MIIAQKAWFHGTLANVRFREGHRHTIDYIVKALSLRLQGLSDANLHRDGFQKFQRDMHLQPLCGQYSEPVRAFEWLGQTFSQKYFSPSVRYHQLKLQVCSGAQDGLMRQWRMIMWLYMGSSSSAESWHLHMGHSPV